jgi:A/G-specific adenine glycosylase
MNHFPTVEQLAKADEAAVLKLWEGLGYYRRARQLHAAARIIVDSHDGQFPRTFNSVLALPGIGRYTAGAIMSIAWDQRYPILEGNTVRLFSRLLGLRTDPRSALNQKRLWEFAESILPRRRAGDFNQALMELGSELCTVKAPACRECPLIKFCPTFAGSLQSLIPASKQKTKYESIEEAVVLIRRNGKFLIRLCPAGERWAGLWDFPRFRLPNFIERSSVVPATESWELANRLERQVEQTWGLEVRLKQTGRPIRHVVTRFRITLHRFEANKVAGRLTSSSGVQTKWASQSELRQLPMNVTARKLADRILEERLTEP